VWLNSFELLVRKALGFKKLNQVIEHEATPQILGMVKKVQHLIKVVD
jgi:large subunit ribosomal protein L30